MSSHSLAKWQPSLFIRFSLALHALVLIWVIIQPDVWIEALVVLLLDHLVVSIFVLWPSNSYLGVNLTRLTEAARLRGEIALTFDDGPDPTVTPRVLEILDQYHAKATFFVIGKRAMRYPELCREIIRRGHALENHSQHHQYIFACLGWSGIMREVSQAQQSIKAVTGREPQFFRAPMGFRSPILDPVLFRLGLQLVTWNQRGYDTVCRDGDLVLSRLIRKLKAGDILLLHDGNGAINANGQPVVLEVLPKLLGIIAGKGFKTVALSKVVV